MRDTRSLTRSKSYNFLFLFSYILIFFITLRTAKLASTRAIAIDTCPNELIYLNWIGSRLFHPSPQPEVCRVSCLCPAAALTFSLVLQNETREFRVSKRSNDARRCREWSHEIFILLITALVLRTIRISNARLYKIHDTEKSEKSNEMKKS